MSNVARSGFEDEEPLMSEEPRGQNGEGAHTAVTLPGVVDKIIPAVGGEPEKAQIAVEGAEALYREIRVDNTLQNAAGEDVSLKLGAQVEVTIEAKPEATTPIKE
jgi:hypothetical protein